MEEDPLIKKIDDLLPQTQCGLCGYGGCQPYATAIARHEAQINLCPPGGIDTLSALATLLEREIGPLIVDMKNKEKPPSKAVIREQECIGCTKCIQACPVDAIIGSAKFMHTVIAAECTGCELCVEPCPVDCIDMVIVDALEPGSKKEQANHARKRFQARNQRLETLASSKVVSAAQAKSKEQEIEARKKDLLEALARTKAKRQKHDP